MTGPAEGKLGLDAIVYLVTNEGKIGVEDAFVCIHVKGYSRARVTHLDIEHESLDELIPPKRGDLHEIVGVEGGIEIKVEKEKEIEHEGNRIRPESVLIQCPTLNKILNQGQETRTWVGGKFGGIYIGFRKLEIKKMERIAKDKFGILPK